MSNQFTKMNNTMTESQIKAEMLIAVIESLDEEHGTSLIDYDYSFPEDVYDTNEYIINNEEAADYCLGFIEMYFEDLATSGNCYWSEEYYNKIIAKYSNELQQYANELIGVKAAKEAALYPKKTFHSAYNIIKKVADDSVVFIYPVGENYTIDWNNVPAVDFDVYTESFVFYKEDFKLANN